MFKISIYPLPQIPQNGGSPASYFVLLEDNFSDQKKIFRQAKNLGGIIDDRFFPLPRHHCSLCATSLLCQNKCKLCACFRWFCATLLYRIICSWAPAAAQSSGHSLLELWRWKRWICALPNKPSK